MNNLRPEFHIAQQFRRDKLRIQNSSNNNPPQLQEYFPNNIEQLSLQQQGLNLDLLQVRTIRNNEANMLDEKPQPQPKPLYSSSEFMSLSSAARSIMPHQYGSSSSSFPNSTSSKEQCGNWRNSSVPHDWMVNYATSSVANEINSSDNNVLPDSMSSQNCGEMHYPNSASSNSLYHNVLQDIFNKASNSSIGGHGSEMASSLMHWGGVNNNAQNYGGISANLWINRGIDNDNNTLGWNNNPLGLTVKRATNDSYSNPHQGLSLSLSSNSQQSNKPFGEGSASNDPQLGNNNNNNVLKSTMMKPSINVSGEFSAGKSSSIHHQDPMGLSSSPNTSYRNVGPLGPFTGYATILKSSRFLKPCQELLDEYCCQQSGVSSSKPDQNKSCDDVSEWISRDHVSGASTSSAVADVVINVLDGTNGGVGGSNGGSSSSSMFYGSKANSSNNGGAAASNFCVSSSSSRPECQKNKAKLVYMQEEVTRRYKQYYQQMQMVVSSFESVAGLNSATPYISLALKSVSRHFRCLKNTISDQLKLICEALGEDISIPMTSPSSKFDTSNITKLRCTEQSFQRNKCGNIDFIEQQQQQHSWRPQRGLPERSVAILKAWLFEHFLHPYPTDTDKHMLATQTGLSRNQVSNWFINARVRVWKPMIEEIHMLETKGGMEGANRSTSKNEGITSASSHHHHHHPRVDDHQHVNMFGDSHVTNSIQERQFQCLQMGSSSSLARANEEGQWNNQEKRSKLESHITSDKDHGTLMGFLPFRHHAGGLEVGGRGPVSLTLGLRHGEGAPTQQQQQLQHEEQLQHHFGGHMIHDFVG